MVVRGSTGLVETGDTRLAKVVGARSARVVVRAANTLRWIKCRQS